MRRCRLTLDEFIALRAVDLLSEYPLLLPLQPRNSQEVRNVFRSGRPGIFGPPKSIQMGGGGERKNEVWMGPYADRRIKLQVQGVGSHPLV